MIPKRGTPLPKTRPESLTDAVTGAAVDESGVAIPVVILGSGLAIDLYPGVEVKH